MFERRFLRGFEICAIYLDAAEGVHGELLPSVNLDGLGEQMCREHASRLSRGDNYAGKFSKDGITGQPDL
jgi:hypothetical protein